MTINQKMVVLRKKLDVAQAKLEVTIMGTEARRSAKAEVQSLEVAMRFYNSRR